MSIQGNGLLRTLDDLESLKQTVVVSTMRDMIWNTVSFDPAHSTAHTPGFQMSP